MAYLFLKLKLIEELFLVISIFINRAPIGKTAEAKDLQGTIVFLASEASDFIIGQDIVVDGGYTII
jgi:enoyl-[acyl-carrier-protein] reductase (NADH)